MMNEKPVAVVLGGTVPHKEMIIQLKDRGYYTILVDYLDDSPARDEADLHIQKSTLDKEKVLEISREYDAELIICGCVDHANITACYAMEHTGKVPPYSYDTALNITNKGYMKKVMMQENIPTSKYIYADKNENVDFDNLNLRYPVIVKPADSNSANGVRKADCREDAEKYLKDAANISRNGRAIIEEYVTGQEISAYCFIKDKKAKLLMTAERISTMDGADEIIKCYASIAPARISKAAEAEAERISTQIAQAFDLDNTALFFQGIVNGDRIDVIEFAPRIGGGVCFKTIKENTGFDVISAIIDSWEGKKVSFDTYNSPSKLLVVNTIYGKDSVFDHIEGVNDILNSNDAIAFYQIRTQGDRIDNSRASSSRTAFFIVKANGESDLLEKVHSVYEKVKVVDIDGNNVIRKDINLEKLWNTIIV